MLDAATEGWRKLRRRVGTRGRSTDRPHELLDAAIDAAITRRRALDEQGRRLVSGQQAAEMQLNSRLAELSSVAARARDLLAQPEHAIDATSSVETLAERAVDLDHTVRQSIEIVTGLAEAVDRARADLRQLARESQRSIAERSKMLSPLDQARQRERVDRTMQDLARPLGPQTATAAEIERRLSARHAAAMTGELHITSSGRSACPADSTADVTAEARDWLADLRASVDGVDGVDAASAPSTPDR